MSIWQAVGLFLAAMLVLMARSAWVQGEFKQFARSLALIGLMFTAIAAIIGLYALVSEGW
jgi:hypothetical protein